MSRILILLALGFSVCLVAANASNETESKRIHHVEIKDIDLGEAYGGPCSAEEYAYYQAVAAIQVAEQHAEAAYNTWQQCEGNSQQMTGSVEVLVETAGDSILH